MVVAKKPGCCILFKILLMAPCVTPASQAISIYRCPSWENLNIICNISPEIWRGIVWTLQDSDPRPESHFNWWDRVNLTRFAPLAGLPPWFLKNRSFKVAWNVFTGQFLTEIHSDHLQNSGHMFRNQLQPIYNKVCSALSPQRVLYKVHCTIIMHFRKPSFAITPPFVVNTLHC